MKHVVISGCNRGIGLELARVFRNNGYLVTGICRQKGEWDGDCIEGVDVTDCDSFKKISFDSKIDYYIHNSGVLKSDHWSEMNWKDISFQFEVNSVGPLKMTHALMPFFKEKAVLGYITSRMGSIADNTSGGQYGYRMSKTALNAAIKSLAIDFEGKFSVGLLHPGYVQTDMTGKRGNITPLQSAEMLFTQINKIHDRHGRFFHANGEELPW